VVCGILIIVKGRLETTISAMCMDESNNIEKIFEKIFKNPLTNCFKCGIISITNEREETS